MPRFKEAQLSSKINNKDNTMDNKEDCIIFKGKEIRDGDGTYLNDSLKFHKPGLKGLSRTLKAHKADAAVCDGLKIRRLTPKECFRLMGVSDEDSDKMAKAGISDSQRYKLAGNSIVVDVLERIFENMFIGKAEETAEAEGVTEKASDFEVKKEALIELIASMNECSTGNEPQILVALSELLAARRSA